MRGNHEGIIHSEIYFKNHTYFQCPLRGSILLRIGIACPGTLCQPFPMNYSLLTTTAFTLSGYRIDRELGLVRGIIVRSRSIIGNFGAALQTLVGGNITLYTNLCERARQEAFDLMLAHARQLGANAVIGVRYDATEVMQGVTEVLCYGTAVSVVPVEK